MNTRKLDVVYVEDNPADSYLMSKVLEENSLDANLDCIQDGQEASNFLLGLSQYSRRRTPDLILLDLNLPRKTGWDILVELKKDQELKRVPVVVITSSANPSDEARAFKLKAHAYLSKPLFLVGFLPLVKIIKACCRLESLGQTA